MKNHVRSEISNKTDLLFGCIFWNNNCCTNIFSFSARATPNPWFPADEAITPSSNAFLGNELILDIAPLTLKEKVGCNSSLLNKILFCRSADNNLAFSRVFWLLLHIYYSIKPYLKYPRLISQHQGKAKSQ